MKKPNNFFSRVFIAMVAISSIMFFQQVSAQKAPKKLADPIPENLMKIFETSCKGCHSTNGNSMAKSMLNFDKWQQLSQKKAAKKAGKIYSAVNSEFMPPKSVRKSKPELIPVKADIEAIKMWAESLKPPVTPKKK